MQHLNLSSVCKKIYANLDLPGSKSIANRVLPIAAIANGVSVIHNVPLVSEDVELMLKALLELGVKITLLKKNPNGTASYQIEGCDGEFPVSDITIFCGNSGTTVRFLGAVLALMPGSYIVTGIERMKERPIVDLVDALRQIGANITYLENPGFPPLKLEGFSDNLVNQLNVSGKVSSQYLTGILIAGTLLKRSLTVHIQDELISQPYVNITCEILKKFGFLISTKEKNYLLPKNLGENNSLNGIEYTVEPDASSASYFLAMASLAGEITVNNLSESSLQGDRNFAKILAKMGAKVIYLANSITVKAHQLNGITIDMEDMPDVAMTIAVLALFAKGQTKITGIASWKVKETDRLQAMYNELTKLGATVIITSSSILINPPQQINSGIAIDTYNDHRMAMCFSLVAVAGVDVIINDYNCVAKTFANYFDLFKQICY